MADTISPAYLTPKQAADYLNVSATTIYALCKSGELKHVRAGRAIRIRPQDLDNLGAVQEFQCLKLRAG